MSHQRMFCRRATTDTTRLGWGSALFVLLMLGTLIASPAHAARKEFWHPIRYDFVSINYMSVFQSDNKAQILSLQSADTNTGALSKNTTNDYRLKFSDGGTGLSFNLWFSALDWLSFSILASQYDRKLQLAQLKPGTTNEVNSAEDIYQGTMSTQQTDIGVVFHTPNEVIVYEAGIAFSRLKNDFTVRGIDTIRLTNIDKNRQAESERMGVNGWMGMRFRMGDRWESDVRFYQSWYDDAYTERSLFEVSVAFSPAPKSELRLSSYYEVNSQQLRTDFGLRLYF